MDKKAKPKYRKKTRELLMRIIFQMTISGDYSDKAKDAFLSDTSLYTGDVEQNEPVGCIFDKAGNESPDLPYLNYVFQSVLDNIAEIDRILEATSKKWAVGRMSAIDLAILRIAVAEMLYADFIDDATSINEAVLMAKKYSSENSPSFINGILGAVTRSEERTARVKTGEGLK